MPLHYESFEITFAPARADTGAYPIHVTSKMGDADGVYTLPFPIVELSRRLATLWRFVFWTDDEIAAPPVQREKIRAEKRAVLIDFGAQLSAGLFSDDVKRLLETSLNRVKPRGGLRIILHLNPPELAALPWELLYWRERGAFLALDPNIALVRTLAQTSIPPRAEPDPTTHHILGILAHVNDQAALDLTGERARIDAALARLRRYKVAPVTWAAGQIDHLDKTVSARRPWTVLHVGGHGTAGTMLVPTVEGGSYRLDSTELGRLIDGCTSLQFAFFNLCRGSETSGADPFSALATETVRRGVPAVLAMQTSVTDEAALRFAPAVYKALADGEPLESAVTTARRSLASGSSEGIVPENFEWFLPVLYARDSYRFPVPVPLARRVLDRFGWGIIAALAALLAIALALSIVLWLRSLPPPPLPIDNLRPAAAANGADVRALALSNDGATLWYATYDTAADQNSLCSRGAHDGTTAAVCTPIAVPAFEGMPDGTHEVIALLVDARDNVWVGLLNRGVVVVQPGTLRMDTWINPDRLPSLNYFTPFALASRATGDGITVWLGQLDALYTLRYSGAYPTLDDSATLTLDPSTPDGVSAIAALAYDPAAAALWIATSDRLLSLPLDSAASPTVYPIAADAIVLEGDRVWTNPSAELMAIERGVIGVPVTSGMRAQSIALDSTRGRLWTGTSCMGDPDCAPLQAYDLNAGEVLRFDGSPTFIDTQDLLVTVAGRVWIATRKGLFTFDESR